MKALRYIMFIIIFSASSCQMDQPKTTFIVTTTVEIKSGEIDDVLKLFQETNPKLVENQSDWIKAVFSKNEETNTVMVQAYWKNRKSYLEFSKSDKFQNTMKKFGPFFLAKPEIEINEVLFEM